MPRRKTRPYYRETESYTKEEAEFLKAIDARRHKYGQNFLPWTEVLRIFKSLGYRRDNDEEK
jgi:hypothetical protein